MGAYATPAAFLRHGCRSFLTALLQHAGAERALPALFRLAADAPASGAGQQGRGPLCPLPGAPLMLSIGKLGRGQESYYLGKVAEGAEDYYSGEGEAEGYWLGDAAEDLGLQGKVEPAQLVTMLTGGDPASGEPLGLRHVQGGAVPG